MLDYKGPAPESDAEEDSDTERRAGMRYAPKRAIRQGGRGRRMMDDSDSDSDDF